ncbi:MAG TPA: response regulator [Aggregatilineales bacterium]|nr:response regulator [Aggregatilineales bacterium]
MAVILYAEDHPPAQLLMQAIIGDLTQHHIELAATGEEAERMAAQLLPALYIVDLDLPDTDGLALAQALRAIHPAPVLLVSAYAEAVKESQFQTLVTAYLPKPLDPEYVAETIERTLA